MMLLNICPEEHDMPFILDHDNVITAAISFHAYRLQAETRLKQYIRSAQNGRCLLLHGER